MLELFFGTTNAGKLRELRRLVDGLPVRVISPDELGRPLPEVVEDGSTFRENAEKKATAYACFAMRYALADDSGLCVDALGGAPGVHSARWSELEDGLASPACGLAGAADRELGDELSRAARDEANNEKLLRALQGREGAQRDAAYVAVLALAAPDGRILTAVEGSCRGRIGHVPLGKNGFGYDPLFVPEAEPARLQREVAPAHALPIRPPRTMAELGPAEKDALSHRGAAFRALRPVLEQLAFDKKGR
ncbi:MAG TPA: non-canonical purine NTP pyrophosphatase [Anaeromyxobacteraceae bacterium]|nr:non-canonical purine NTP pyrophosphatase [Anaeromyxobacteraceae bacterium]